MTVTFLPIGDRLITLPIKPESEIRGIALPDSVAEKQNAMTARVIAAGPGLWASDGRRVEMQVRVGDRVTFDAKLCTGVPFEGQMYWVINERDVIAVVRGLDPDGSAAS